MRCRITALLTAGKKNPGRNDRGIIKPSGGRWLGNQSGCDCYESLEKVDHPFAEWRMKS
jgi:hypothetical protein